MKKAYRVFISTIVLLCAVLVALTSCAPANQGNGARPVLSLQYRGTYTHRSVLGTGTITANAETITFYRVPMITTVQEWSSGQLKPKVVSYISGSGNYASITGNGTVTIRANIWIEMPGVHREMRTFTITTNTQNQFVLNGLSFMR